MDANFEALLAVHTASIDIDTDTDDDGRDEFALRQIMHAEYRGIIDHVMDRIDLGDNVDVMPLLDSLSTFVSEFEESSSGTSYPQRIATVPQVFHRHYGYYVWVRQNCRRGR